MNHRNHFVFDGKSEYVRDRFLKSKVQWRKSSLKRLSSATVRLIFPDFRLGMIGMNQSSGYGKPFHLCPFILIGFL